MRTLQRFRNEIITSLIMFVSLIIISKLLLKDEHWLAFSIKWSIFWLAGSIIAALVSKKGFSSGQITLMRCSFAIVTLVITIAIFSNPIVFNAVRAIVYPLIFSFLFSLTPADKKSP